VWTVICEASQMYLRSRVGLVVLCLSAARGRLLITCIYFIALALHGFIIDTYWHSGDSIFIILCVISFLHWQSQARIKEGQGGLTASLKRFSHFRNIDSIVMNILAFGLMQILMYSNTGCELSVVFGKTLEWLGCCRLFGHYFFM
jgi:hypothetical protein